MLLLGGFVYLWSGIALERSASGGMADFKAVYFAARCLLRHRDLYRPSEFLLTYLEEEGPTGAEILRSEPLQKAITVCINLPTTLLIVSPFAFLPWSMAHILWSTLTTFAYFFAAFLIWKVASEFSPILSGALIGFVLATSQVLFAGGNTAGMVVSLCIISICCFLRSHYQIVGIFCLTISLLLKPHDVGVIWFFFLLSNLAHRKLALRTAALTLILGMSAVLWISAVAPRWPQELSVNIHSASAKGEINDPGPTSITYRSPAMIIDLQSIVSILRDDPPFYDAVSYIVCGSLGLVWVAATLRSRPSQAEAWLALVPAVALTLLITYHHPYDAKLLLVSVPATVRLWKNGGFIGVAALVTCATSLVVTADIPILLLKMLMGAISFWPPGRLEMIFLGHPAPLALLVLASFFLTIYVCQSWRHEEPADPTPSHGSAAKRPRRPPPSSSRICITANPSR